MLRFQFYTIIEVDRATSVATQWCWRNDGRIESPSSFASFRACVADALQSELASEPLPPGTSFGDLIVIRERITRRSPGEFLLRRFELIRELGRRALSEEPGATLRPRLESMLCLAERLIAEARRAAALSAGASPLRS